MIGQNDAYTPTIENTIMFPTLPSATDILTPEGDSETPHLSATQVREHPPLTD